jgi:antitoxin CptB
MEGRMAANWRNRPFQATPPLTKGFSVAISTSPGESGLLAFDDMNEPQPTDSEIRKRRLLFRAWHRGTREMDLLLGRFADSEVGRLNEGEMAAFEKLLDAPEPDIYHWIMGTMPAPDEYDAALMRKIHQFHLGSASLP